MEISIVNRFASLARYPAGARLRPAVSQQRRAAQAGTTLLLCEDDPHSAIRVFDEDRRGGPGTSGLLGLARHQMDDGPAAGHHFRETLEEQSQMVEAYYSPNTACAAMGRPDEGQAYREAPRPVIAKSADDAPRGLSSTPDTGCEPSGRQKQ